MNGFFGVGKVTCSGSSSIGIGTIGVGWNGSFLGGRGAMIAGIPIPKNSTIKKVVIMGTSNIFTRIPVRIRAKIEFRTKTFTASLTQIPCCLVVQEPFNVFANT